MAEYIERDYVKDWIHAVNSTGGFKRYDDYMWLMDKVIEAEAADLQPIRHGRWIIADDVEHFIAICSECGMTEDSRDIKDMPYCHCGARMIKDGDSKC